MTLKKFNPRMIVLLLIIVVVALMRLAVVFSAEPFVDFTPVGAMALFGGAYFTGRLKPFVFPLLALFISDLILGFTIYRPYTSALLYTNWYWTYAAFALMVLAGKLMIKGHVIVLNILMAVLVATLIHWLVSDIGGCLVEKTPGAAWTVYLERLITAIPHELRFFTGTLVYSALMFGSMEWLQRRYPGLQPAPLG